jgi:heat-inducible transcriptional repressor
MADVSHDDEDLINQLSESVEKIFSLENDNIHLKGTQNILSYPEFSNQDKISKLLELFDDQKILIGILNESTKEDEKISITIGQENRTELVCHCSLITAVYRIGDITGTLGIIGPTRMKYEKVTGLVDYITQKITSLFS